ncbi:hypothetical protein WA026_023198 [Henosepilachna vigintioctopunctata]|uniref:MADF domain-containing protein n=1 Tax=Henosepilachna vigintioctopunctata TaxID=420089 RepID=A0AAW1UGN9_9CUCU
MVGEESEVFKGRNKKKNALLKLLEIYQRIEPNANVDSLKKRVENIKTCYLRELKKVEQSVRSGRWADDEYVPNLWYFELLEFLRDQEIQIPGVSTVYLEEKEAQVEVEDVQQLPGSPAAQSYSQKRKKTIVEHLADGNDLLIKAVGQLAKKNN